MKPFQYNTYLETTKNFEDTIIRNYGDISWQKHILVL
jgi:hypothetical protein